METFEKNAAIILGIIMVLALLHYVTKPTSPSSHVNPDNQVWAEVGR